jgi:TonB-linked SusC/RagA family outer membrane protein
MYKNTNHFGKPKPLYHKILLIMRLTTLILITAIMQVNASSFAQKITLSEKNMPLSEILEEIRTQTGYDFLFKTVSLNQARKVSIRVKNAELKDVLDRLLAPQHLEYVIDNKSVIISKRTPGVFDRFSAFFLAIDVRGRVADGNGSPLAGASVKVEGSPQTYSTNSKGLFSISNVQENAVLTISYIGYKTTTVRLSKAVMPLVITLQEDLNELDQVAVYTGYQQIKAEQLTGAVSTITSKELEKRTIISGNFLESLEGRLAGLVYNNRNPNTPADERLSIRGVSTFDGVKSPLIVIDGFPTDIDINSINPNNIASVNILRDAAASTIYGARAANGVIVIETKKGAKGKPAISLRSAVSFQEGPDFGDLKLVRSEEYIAIKKDRVTNITASRPAVTGTQQDPVTSIVYDQREGLITEAEANQKLAELGQYHNLNSYNDLFYRTSLTQNYELAISGGGESNTYRMGVNFIGNNTRERNNNNDRIVFNLRDNLKISDRFNLDMSGIYSHQKNSSKGAIPAYTSLLPYKPIVDENGNGLPNYNNLRATDLNNSQAMAFGLYDRRANPYGDYLTDDNQGNINTLRAQLRLNTKIVKGLDFDLGGAYETSDERNDNLLDNQSFVVRDLLNRTALKDPSTGNALYTDVPQGDVLKKSSSRLNSYMFRAQLNANYKLGSSQQHEIFGILGTEVRKIETNSYLTSFFGYDDQTLLASPVNFQTLSARTNVSGFPQFSYGIASFNLDNYFNQRNSDRRFRSYYSQATYIYNKKYILSGSVRLDQSNLFGTDPKNRDKPQWSAGASWLIDQESFMEPAKNWISSLKLRAAYGLTGNVPTSQSGRFVLLTTSKRGNLTPASTTNSISSPENQSIRWENTKNLNLGLDFGMFNNRLTGTLDYYNKNTTYVLGSTPADPTTGWSTYLANTANIDNNGVELGLSFKNIQTSRFSWSTGLTGSFNENKIIKVYNGNPSGYRTNYIINSTTPNEGFALNSLVSYNYAGLNADGIPTMITRDGTVQTIASSNSIILTDLINSGTITPKFVSGLSNTLRYKDFELFAMFMFYGGHVARVAPANAEADYPISGSSNYWKQAGDETKTNIPALQPKFSSPNYSAHSFGKSVYTKAEDFVVKADQLRLRDVALTYHLPVNFLSRIKLADTQLRFQVQNAWRYTFSGNDIDMEAIDPVTGNRGLHTKPSFIFSFITQF